LIRITSVCVKPRAKRFNEFGVKLPNKLVRVWAFPYDPWIKVIRSSVQDATLQCDSASNVFERLRLKARSLAALVLGLHTNLNRGGGSG